MSTLETGQKPPQFEIEAVESGRTVGRSHLGTKTVLIFHGPKTQDAPKTVGKAVRAKWPDASDVSVANIVNLKSMGGLWKKVASAQIKQTYEKLASKLTDVDPAEYVIICPDWDNAVGPLFGVEDSNSEAAVVVLDEEGAVLGVQVGEDLAAATLGFLA